MTSFATVEAGFRAAFIPDELIDELLQAFIEAKRRFYRDDLRPSAVEGGRFTEAVFRILEWKVNGGAYTPLGKTLPSVDKLLVTMVNASGQAESIRMHIPRTLRLIYDVRNKRDAAHLGDGIDPNVQDASLVIHNMDWVLAELVRLYHNVQAAEAHRIIVDLVSREVPVIQVIDGFPVLLKTLGASHHCLALLFWRSDEGMTFDELNKWVRPAMRANLRRTLRALEEKRLIHYGNEPEIPSSARIVLTREGAKEVVSLRLVEPA